MKTSVNTFDIHDIAIGYQSIPLNKNANINNSNDFNQYSRKVVVLNKELPYDFRNRLKYLRKKLNLTREKLSELSYISDQTIKQIENDENRGYTLDTIISLCIGMNLSPDLSIPLIESSGYCIGYNSSKLIVAYNYILRNMYYCSIDEINDFLEANNLKKLSDNYK